MKIKKIASGCLITFIIFIIWGFIGLHMTYRTKTESNATPDSVSFLDLPESASNIGYWRDGLNYWAEFNIPEDDFRKLFYEYKFNDFKELPITPLKNHEFTELVITPKKFGDLNTFPTHSREEKLWVTSGLHYEERWKNGGGYEIIYDRSRSRAYYSFSKR